MALTHSLTHSLIHSFTHSLTHLIVTNSFVKVRLTFFCSAHMFGMFYGGTRNACSFVQTTWRNAARRSKMTFVGFENKNFLLD